MEQTTISSPKVAAYIIGKKGQTVNRVREMSGANINIDSDYVKICGKESCVRVAVKLVEDIVVRYERHHQQGEEDIRPKVIIEKTRALSAQAMDH